jgi:acyl-CoA thioester hydrolase
MPGITTPYEGSSAAPWRDGAVIPAPLRLHETAVCQDWVDYNGHMSESAYLLVFGDSSDAFFRFFGVDEQYRASGRSLYTAETHLRHLREAKLGDRLQLTLQVLGVDSKRLHILHEMYHADGQMVATAEQLLVHADTRSGRAAPFPGLVAGRLAKIQAAHAALPVPGYVGHVITIGRR